MGDTVSYSVVRNEPALAELSATVERELEERHIAPNVSFAVQLVIDELVSNIVKDGSGAPADSAIGVRLHFESDAVAVEIENQGDRFNPLENPDPDLDLPLEQRPIGGLGIHLSRKMMDDFEYSYRDGNNLMSLRKKFPMDE